MLAGLKAVELQLRLQLLPLLARWRSFIQAEKGILLPGILELMPLQLGDECDVRIARVLRCNVWGRGGLASSCRLALRPSGLGPVEARSRSQLMPWPGIGRRALMMSAYCRQTRNASEVVPWARSRCDDCGSCCKSWRTTDATP